VRYAPGVIEARGFRGGRQVMTARRETTGAPAKLALRTDRAELAADGEDVAVCAVEVRDAQGRLVPITDNLVTFAVKGSGRVLGVGNGDPTSHESDIGTSRRAFGGLCMAIVQASKAAGSIEIEATSPGLERATTRLAVRATALRPQVPAWERPVPEGPGVTGLWRPAEIADAGGSKDPFVAAALGSRHDMVFSLRQQGSTITGELDEVGDGFFNFNAGGAIEDGRIDGARISFRVASMTYSGTATADRIELSASRQLPFSPGGGAAAAGPQPAVGPVPDGSDPSLPTEMFAALFAPQRLILQRARR
jgi:beta-galactosidase